MNKRAEAKQILLELQVPPAQQSDVCCFALLALAGMSNNSAWNQASNEWLRIHDIMSWTRKHYDVDYAENSRETFRKQAIHHFRNAAFIEDNGKATNSPNYRYRLTDEMLALLRSFGGEMWQQNKDKFTEEHESLISQYASKKSMRKMPVKINNKSFSFSPGKHNQLQKAILEEFAPRFAPHSECLYVGDTTAKDLVKKESKLRELGFEITLHDKMPDVVLFIDDKKWIFFIEAVTSVGAITYKRLHEIKEMTKNVTSGKIFVTAFPDFKTYQKFAGSLAWDTEVWISNLPDHMIHLNGDSFLGPR